MPRFCQRSNHYLFNVFGLTRRSNNVYCEPGWKLTRWIFSQLWILRPEMLNLDPSPLRIEPHRGSLIIYHKPGSKFKRIKHVMIFTGMLYSIKKLNFIPVFTHLFVLCCSWFVMSQNPKEFWPFLSPTGAFLPDYWKLKKRLKMCIHQVKYLMFSGLQSWIFIKITFFF
jgi:hypothetical protein